MFIKTFFLKTKIIFLSFLSITLIKINLDLIAMGFTLRAQNLSGFIIVIIIIIIRIYRFLKKKSKNRLLFFGTYL